jgi:hypothetical protein
MSAVVEKLIFIFHPENIMYNASADGTFEKREI